MGRASRLAILSCVVLAALAGCSKPKPSDDRPYLAQFGLDTPLSMNVSLRQPVDAQGNLSVTGDTPAIALLLHLGALKVAPNAAGSPWWSFNTTSGALSNGILTIPAAKRVITGRADEKSWSEGGADRYAETVSYTIEPLPPFAGLPNIPPMTSAIRLQLRKGPSDDQWHLSYDNDNVTTIQSNQDAGTFAQTVVSTGSQYEGELASAIQAARTAAFDQIEKSFADQGIFKRVDGGVIASTRNNLAYYPEPGSVVGATYVDAEQHCALTHVGNYHWRLPTLTELYTLVNTDKKIIDIPDGRLWSAITQSNPGQAILMVANTFVINNGPQLTLDQVDPASLNQYAWGRHLLEYNPDTIWGVYQTLESDAGSETLVGYLAFLMLNEDGASALKEGGLDVLHPAAALLAPSGERPHLIYVWAVVARGLGAVAVPLTTHAMGPLYAGLSLCGTAATEAGAKAMRGFGFKPVRQNRPDVGNLFWLDRSSQPKAQPPTPAPNPRVLASRFKVVIAQSPREVQQAFAIRAAVFMVEQNCPFDEEFDGNDYTATQIVGYMDGEPAATLRIRYFAGFVKIERLAVLPRFRGSLIHKEVVQTALEFCRRKGYVKAYGHAQKRLVPLWSRFGFKVIATAAPFVFSDHEYLEMEVDLAPHANAINIGTDPYVMVRPEGSWDTPGVLDESSTRQATNPH